MMGTVTSCSTDGSGPSKNKFFRSHRNYIKVSKLTFVKPSPAGYIRRSSDKVFVLFGHANRNDVRLENYGLVEPESGEFTIKTFALEDISSFCFTSEVPNRTQKFSGRIADVMQRFALVSPDSRKVPLQSTSRTRPVVKASRTVAH